MLSWGQRYPTRPLINQAWPVEAHDLLEAIPTSPTYIKAGNPFSGYHPCRYSMSVACGPRGAKTPLQIARGSICASHRGDSRDRSCAVLHLVIPSLYLGFPADDDMSRCIVSSLGDQERHDAGTRQRSFYNKRCQICPQGEGPSFSTNQMGNQERERTRERDRKREKKREKNVVHDVAYILIVEHRRFLPLEQTNKHGDCARLCVTSLRHELIR